MATASGRILVTFASLEDAVMDLNQTRAALDQRLDDLKSFLAQLNVTWQGGAHEQYAAYQAMWDQSYLGLNEVLGRIGVLLDQKLADYIATEQANTASWAV